MAKCDKLGEAIPESKLDTQFNILYDYDSERAWDSWYGCLGDYSVVLAMYEILRFLTIISVFLVILSWKFDILKKKT